MEPRLIEQARSGDREAFARLAAEASDQLYGLALRVLRNPDAAGEALQMALVQIWRDLPNLRDPDRFDAWTYRIVINCCRADRRRARRSLVTLELSPEDSVVGDAQMSIAQRDELEQAFGVLTTDQRAVLVLLYYRDLTVREAANVLGISEGTVKSRAHHARQAMRAALAAAARPRSREGHPA